MLEHGGSPANAVAGTMRLPGSQQKKRRGEGGERFYISERGEGGVRGGGKKILRHLSASEQQHGRGGGEDRGGWGGCGGGGGRRKGTRMCEGLGLIPASSSLLSVSTLIRIMYHQRARKVGLGQGEKG